MNKNMREFNAVILEDESGGYIALVPGFLGCRTQGDSLDEVIRNVKEAL